MNPVTIGEATLSGLSKYFARADGEVVSLWGKPRVLKGGTDKDGYRKFVLIDDDGRRRYMRRSCFVCTAFHGERPEGMTVRHGDGSRTNDAPSNLSWSTHSVNCSDKVAHGTAQRGERNGNACISEETARKIKELLHLPTPVVSERLGVKRHIVNNIRYGNSWGWMFSPDQPWPVRIEQACAQGVLFPPDPPRPVQLEIAA